MLGVAVAAGGKGCGSVVVEAHAAVAAPTASVAGVVEGQVGAQAHEGVGGVCPG